MKQTHRNSLKFVLIIFMVIALTSCALGQGVKFVSKNKANDEMHYSKEEASQYEECVNVILDNGTKAFFGNYRVDENFFSYIVSNFGLKTLKKICKNGDFNNPEIWYKYTGNTINSLWFYYKNDQHFHFENEDRVIAKNTKSSKTVLEFTGDFSLANDISTVKYLRDRGNDITKCFSPNLLKEMRGADIFSVNNEFCYSTRGEALKGKDYTFRANPTDCALLKNIGVDFVNLANNHSYDYGEEALLDTLDTLSVYNIPYVGAGRNLDEASRPLYYVLNGRKIAFVSATQIERSANYTREATESSAGVLKTLKPDRYVSVIQEASKNADIVIAIVHWGTEGNDRYGADQVELARAFVDAGADCIIGCHSHCLQGVEFIDNVPVFYSLGNYWFAVDDKMPESFKTGIAKIEIGEDGSVNPYFLPCEFNMGVTKLITEQSERAKDCAYLESLSTSARVDSKGRIFAK